MVATKWRARAVSVDRRGLWGQAALGGGQGLVWSPCVGPTLGAAALLAAQGRDLLQVTLVMVAFGAGAAAPCGPGRLILQLVVAG